MKRTVSYFFAVFCALILMTSCDHSITPDSITGTYRGTMDIKFNISGVEFADVEVPSHVDVTKVDDAYVNVAIDLDLAKYIDSSWATLVGSNLDFGVITAKCLVGPTIDGEAPLTGTAKVGDTTFPIVGECEGSTLDLTLTIGIVTVEFEGIKR